MVNTINSTILELTDTNFKFSLNVDNNPEYTKVFNLRIEDNRFKFSPNDIKTLFVLPKVYTAFLRAFYPKAEVYINYPISKKEYYPLEILTHLERRVISHKLRTELLKSKIKEWHIKNSNIDTHFSTNVKYKHYDCVLPISGGKDSMLTYFLERKVGWTVFPFIINYGGYRWSLFEKRMAKEWLPAKGIFPIIVSMPFGGSNRPLIPAYNKVNKIYEGYDIKDAYIDWYGFLNYTVGLVIASKVKGYFTPAIESPHWRYKENDGIWAFMFDETQLATEVVKELSKINGGYTKIASPILAFEDAYEYKLMHKYDKNFRDIITSCGFGKQKWCYRCHKDAQAYFRWLINGIDPMEYGLDTEKLASKSQMIKRGLDSYEAYVTKYRRIVPNEEFGYLHYLLDKGKLNSNIPQKIKDFISLFPKYKNKEKILAIKLNNTMFIPNRFKIIYDETGDMFINNGYKEFSKMFMSEKLHTIAKANDFKEDTL